MKKFAILALTFTLVSSTLITQASLADWKKKVDCNYGGVAIDTRMEGTAQKYQIVLREPKAVQRFVDVTHLGPSINEKGELILEIAPAQPKGLAVKSFFTTLPISSSRNGYVKDMSVDIDGGGTLILNLIGNGPTGPETVNLWNFYHCQML